MFITVEGPNGIGKSSLVKEIAENLRTLGYQVYETKEPTTTELGQFIRSKEGEIEGLPFAYLIAADRYLHIKNEIEKKLHEKMIVISDRYVLSSLVLQQLDGLNLDLIWSLNKFSIRPNLTILLTGDDKIIENRIGLREKKTRLEIENSVGDEINLYNSAMDFLKKKDFNFITINNTSHSIEDNSKIIVDYIKKLITQK